MDITRLRTLTYETTRDLTGETFEVRFPDAPTMEMKLEEVEKLIEKHVNPRMERDTFAWRFRGPQQPVLAQGTYAFYHPSLGEPLPLFIVPISATGDGSLYEAIFT